MNKVKSTKKRKPPPRAAAMSVVTESLGPEMAHASVDSRDAAGAAPPLDAATGLAAKVYLESSLEIKDVEDAHRQLMALLARTSAVAVDVSRVGAVDTAGVQLLLAFQSEAVNRGVAVAFCGESAALKHALSALGLSDAFRMAVA
jgi:ABC-type transporter Mla MlaB component